MKLHIFCVFDSASDQYGNPMFLISPGQALRSFSDEINRLSSDNLMYQHPDDFVLFELGSFDTNEGIFSTKVPVQVCLGKLVKVRS